ncbi:Lrp/AsnC ligand binding domain-containing protein [Algivirga pacifica]|uniref:Lrp/AsnC ligand binding domain-containing protein n=2 Tax=Algivirga pacifica TaxID=1162670 RepID=A0ABP9D6I6_9BACT
MDYPIDYTDRQIIKELLRNGRKSYLQIARDLNISNSLVHQRINKMMDAGIISSPSLGIAPQKLGWACCAFVNVIVKEGRMVKQVIEELKSIEEVVECHYVSGGYTLILKVYTKSSEHLSALLMNTLTNIEGVASTETNIVFSTSFERNVPID